MNAFMKIILIFEEHLIGSFINLMVGRTESEGLPTHLELKFLSASGTIYLRPIKLLGTAE